MKKFSKIFVVVLILMTAFQASGAARFKNADKDKKDREFLQICASGSDNDIIRALKNGADPNVSDKQGKTPLMYAAEKHGAKVIEALLKAGADSGFAGAIELAAQYNPDPNVIDALILGDIEAMKSRNSNYPQSYIDKIISYQLNSKTRSGFLLSIAARENNQNVVKKLISLGAHVNTDDNSSVPLIEAAYNKKNPKVIEVLIDAGADDVKDDEGRKALSHAAQANNIEAMKILIDAGAEDAADRYGRKALWYAAHENNIEAMKVLIKAGTDINFGKKETALTSTLDKPNVEALRTLINAGADVNKGVVDVVAWGEQSPLQYAKSRLEYAKSHRNNDEIRDFSECVKLLTRAGAK